MGAIAPIRTAMVHFPNEFRAHVPPGKFWDWSSLRCSVVHSGRFKLANAWIPYWTCNAQIFNKPQEGGRGPLGPPVNPPLDSKCYLEQQWKAIFAWDWNKSFTHTYTHTPTPNTVSEQLATEGFGELNTSPYYWIFTSVSVGSIPRYYSVAERGEVPGGPPSPLIFRPNWGPKGPKKNFFVIAPPPPPYLRVWMNAPLPPYLKVWIRRRYWLTRSRYGANACSNCTKVWLKTYPVCDAPLSNSARCSLVLLQNSRRNHTFPVWFLCWGKS